MEGPDIPRTSTAKKESQHRSFGASPPKGPRRTKNTACSRFTTRSEFTSGGAWKKHYSIVIPYFFYRHSWETGFYPVRVLGRAVFLPLRVPNPSPTLDKNLASMVPGILSSIGVGVWRNRSGAFPDSNTYIQQTGVYPYPLVAGSARPNPRMGAPDPENPLFLGFFVLRGGPRPWSETMVSEGARPWGGGRSGDCELCWIHFSVRRSGFSTAGSFGHNPGVAERAFRRS